jgi:exopolysaccharide biosynthesis protein
MKLAWSPRYYPYVLLFGFVLGVGLLVSNTIWQQAKTQQNITSSNESRQAKFAALLPRYEQLAAKIKEAQSKGIDVAAVLEKRTVIAALLLSGEYTKAEEEITTALALVDTLLADKQAADAQKAAELERQKAAQATPAPTPAPKVTVTATAQPVTSTTSPSKYESKSVSTSRGTFSVSVLTVELGSGKARMITDTASDSDCSDNCPTLSLASYVSRNGGFAGINGTYFCPTDYADCAGKTNTFYWKIYNTRLQKIINQNNGQGEGDPAIVFTSDGSPRFFSRWSDFVASGISVTAGINSKPSLVNGGRNVLDEGQLDSKQRSTKSNRGALGVKGSTLYSVVARSATVPDLAEIMVSLGVDSAMNIDGGGSSALYYKGSYKVGPGRSLPNAVIFAE